MEDNDKIVELIRKCLSLATSPNENEAAAAMAKAQELLDKYNLDLADVSIEQDKAADVFRSEIEYGYEWRRMLYVGVAKQNFCSVIGLPGKKSLKVFGRLPNVFATYEMAEWLSGQLERLANIAALDYNNYHLTSDGRFVRGDNKALFHTDFLFGAVQRVLFRLEELNEERRKGIPNISALAVRLREEATEVRNEEYPNRSQHRLVVRQGSAGYAQGVEAGDKVGIVPPSRHVTKDNGLYLTGGK